MRLLNVNTLEFKWFVTGSKEQGPPPYIILSHTWGEDEVSFEEHEAWLKARRTDPSTPEPDKAGFRKIKEFCRVCREDYHIILEHTFWISRARTYAHKMNDPGSELKSIHGSEDMATLSEAVEWAWVDACCIDKRSSAELSEAINSMYRWYREAAICVAYLVDTLQLAGDETAENVALSRWWKRGWTLQELIAPVDVHFYNTDWVHFWSRKGHAGEIAVISSVDEHLLRDSMEIPSKNYPIGTILSWAANRETTRIEDRSYSLLGLLDVSMPLLYGEGDKAFARLRDEVLKDSEDPSILVWRPRYADFDLDAGLAPASLDSFMFWRWRDLQVTRRASGLRMERTVYGLLVPAILIKIKYQEVGEQSQGTVAVLNLDFRGSDESNEPYRLGLLVTNCGHRNGRDLYRRTCGISEHKSGLIAVSPELLWTTISKWSHKILGGEVLEREPEPILFKW